MITSWKQVLIGDDKKLTPLIRHRKKACPNNWLLNRDKWAGHNWFGISATWSVIVSWGWKTRAQSMNSHFQDHVRKIVSSQIRWWRKKKVWSWCRNDDDPSALLLESLLQINQLFSERERIEVKLHERSTSWRKIRHNSGEVRLKGGVKWRAK